jgi:hypothetical protein
MKFNVLKYLSTVILSACVFALSTFAAPPPVTVAQPVAVQVINPVEVTGTVKVEVTKPVTVQGAVENLSDSLNETFLKKFFVAVTPDKFKIPAGKRLIIESIIYDVNALASDSFKVAFVMDRNAGNQLHEQFLTALPRQSAVPFAFNGKTRVVVSAALPTRLRIDYTGDAEIYFYLSYLGDQDSGDATGSATVSGYFVDM